MLKRNLLLLAAVVALAVAPLLIHGPHAAFSGSDGQAEQLITQLDPGYVPWAAPLWKPPSSEIESLLFALQAALGAGLLGYYFGRRRALGEVGALGVASAPEGAGARTTDAAGHAPD